MVFLLRGTGLVPQLGLTSYSRSANAGEAPTYLLTDINAGKICQLDLEGSVVVGHLSNSSPLHFALSLSSCFPPLFRARLALCSMLQLLFALEDLTPELLVTKVVPSGIEGSLSHSLFTC